jgi:hypothetical protein
MFTTELLRMIGWEKGMLIVSLCELPVMTAQDVVWRFDLAIIAVTTGWFFMLLMLRQF